jgi:NADP-dependent 3-hydroxy acid dehydrogenase YdfG
MKSILITGGSSGIGEATAELLVQQGHHVFIMGRSGQKLHEIQERLGSTCHVVVGNVQHPDDCKRAMETVMMHTGRLDVLVNNAGLGIFDPLKIAKLEDWHEMIDTNIKGLLNMIHACLPSLLESKGHIINLGSVASHHVFANSGIYCATKHAVLAISESLKIEHGKDLRVTTISPGSVNTPFIHVTTNEALLKEYVPNFEKGLSPFDIAGQISHAIHAPKGVNISEIIVRPGV